MELSHYCVFPLAYTKLIGHLKDSKWKYPEEEEKAGEVWQEFFVAWYSWFKAFSTLAGWQITHQKNIFIPPSSDLTPANHQHSICELSNLWISQSAGRSLIDLNLGVWTLRAICEISDDINIVF